MSTALHGGERDPFSLTANPDGYVESASIEKVLADCVTALDAGRVPVIVGPTGLGKTLVLQLLARARSERSQPIYIPFCTLGPDELATLALGLLDHDAGAEPEVELLDAARRVAEGGQSLLLLVDDAAALPGETAAQLAHWLNASGGTLQIALAGLPGPALRHARDAFGDRAEELLLVGGLKPNEIREYVNARLEAAAADPEVRAAFGDSALAELARVSEGNPRRLNLAAQAIVRHARSEVDAPAATGAGAPIRTTAHDLLNVGEYRFVRGRFVDPDSGDAGDAGDSSDPGERGESVAAEAEVPRVEDTKAPPPRPPAPPPPVREPPPQRPPLERAAPTLLEPEIDPPPAGAFEAFNRELSPEDRIQPPRDLDERSIPMSGGNPSVRWIGGGIALLAVAVGLCTLGDSDPPATQVAEAPAVPAPEALATPSTGIDPVPADARPFGQEPEAAEIAAVERPPVAAETPEPVATRPAPAPVVAAPQPAPVVVPEPEPVGREPVPEVAAVAEPIPPVEPAPVVAEVVPPQAVTVPVAINATPWAVIEVDGEEIGETPLAGIQLSIGRHRFKARMPDGKIQERVVRIDADTPTVVFE